MLCKTWKINSKDFTQYAHKAGLQVAYTHLKGLPDKHTIDGTKHADIIKSKRVFSIRTNPVTEAVAAQILTEYNSGLQYLTIFDLASGTDITILTEPSTVVGDPALVDSDGDITYYQLAVLTFEEL